jgi:hypothetical protein
MRLNSRDIAKLGWQALAALVMIAAATGLVFWSAGDERQAVARRDAARAGKEQIEQRLRQVRTEEQEIKARTQQYHAMEERGIAGPEKRLDWSELLRTLRTQIGLPGMTYELAAQVPLEKATGAGPAYHVSSMKLQLQLLHEEDLLNFLQRLQQEASALIIVRSCKIGRIAATPAGEQNALLNAECLIDWITLHRTNPEARP